MSLRLRALARPSSILSTGPLTTNTRTTAGAIAATASRARFLSATPSPRGGGHDSHYDAPAGWLFGVKPGEKYEKEGWENVTYYAFLPLMVGFVGVYAFKPDTSIQTWALEEARRRLEAEGILPDPDLKKD